MKWLVVAGWVLFGLEALFVAMLALQRNMGDDAAGRGMATGFAIVLAPIVLVAGGLFLWGQRGGPKAAFWVGLAMVASPVLFAAFSLATGTLGKAGRAMERAQYGRFDDPALTRIARAIDRKDVAELRKLVGANKPDFAARDRRGRTILGHAVSRAVADYEGKTAVEAVRILLQAGAPPAVDAIKAEVTMASISEHNLIYHVFGANTPGTPELLDALLSAGASPNVVDEDGRSLVFSTYASVPKLEVLARHGANLQALDTREDRKQWTALMNAVYMKAWAEALFFLQHGVPVDYTAPDGNSVTTILNEVDPPGSTYHGAEDAAHAAFRAALGR